MYVIEIVLGIRRSHAHACGAPFTAIDGGVQVERVEKSSLSGDSLVDLVHVVLQNAVIAAESEELGQVPRAA